MFFVFPVRLFLLVDRDSGLSRYCDVNGVRCQVSGVRKKKTEKKLGSYSTMAYFCFLSSVLFPLKPEH